MLTGKARKVIPPPTITVDQFVDENIANDTLMVWDFLNVFRYLCVVCVTCVLCCENCLFVVHCASNVGGVDYDCELARCECNTILFCFPTVFVVCGKFSNDILVWVYLHGTHKCLCAKHCVSSWFLFALWHILTFCIVVIHSQQTIVIKSNHI